MKRRFWVTVTVPFVFLFQFFLLGSCGGTRPKEINISDSIASLHKVALPYDYEEWLNWSSDYYSDKGVNDESRFAHYDAEDHAWLNDIFKRENDGKEITGFAHIFTPLFQVLDNGEKDFHTFVVGGDSNKDVLVLMNVSNGGALLSQLKISCQDATGNIDGFIINEDLSIQLYKGQLEYDNTQERGLIRNREIVDIYKIQDDGSICLGKSKKATDTQIQLLSHK